MTTHEGLCLTPGCPWPSDLDAHIPWCQGVHRCFGGPTHQHWPKKGMGGHNPKSRIVAILCAGMHDAVDNGFKYGNAVVTDGEGREVYRLWQVTKDPPGKTLVERVIGEAGRGKHLPSPEGEVDLCNPARFSDHPQEDTAIALPTPLGASQGVSVGIPATYGATGLTLPDALPYEGWLSVGHTLAGMHRCLLWWIGDWILFGEAHYADKYSQAIELTGLAKHTLQNAVSVCERFEPSRRRENLSFSHHAEVAYEEPQEQETLLDRAEAEDLTRGELRAIVQAEKGQEVSIPECPDSADGKHHWNKCSACGATR